MPARKLPPNEAVIAMYESGMSTGEIAEKCNVAPITVLSLLRRLGIVRRSAKEAAELREERGRANPPRYWLGKKQPREMVERRIAGITGPKHWLWKGGKSIRRYRRKVPKDTCERCSTRQNLGIHHKDFDHYNDAVTNLSILCVSCHMSIHKTAYWNAIHKGQEPPRSNGLIGWTRNKDTDA